MLGTAVTRLSWLLGSSGVCLLGARSAERVRRLVTERSVAPQGLVFYKSLLGLTERARGWAERSVARCDRARSVRV
jgi:hypothetical protein